MVESAANVINLDDPRIAEMQGRNIRPGEMPAPTARFRSAFLIVFYALVLVPQRFVGDGTPDVRKWLFPGIGRATPQGLWHY